MESVSTHLFVLLGQLILLFFLVQRSITAIYTALLRVTRSQSASNIGLALLFFPGTVLHELAHFFAAIALFLKVREIHLLPEWDHQSIKLGHVTYVRADVFRGMLVGIAPLFAGLLFFWGLYSWNVLPPSSIGLGILLGYIIFTVSSTMFSSKQDLVDLVYVLPFLIVVGVLLLLFPSIRIFLVETIGTFISDREGSISAFLSSVNSITFLSLLVHLIIPPLFRLLRLA